MRKLLLPVLFCAGFLAAGSLSAGVVVAATTSGTTGTTTAPTTTGTPPPPPPPPAPPAVLPAGVTVGGVAVGGLTFEAAEAELRRRFARPLLLVVGNKRFRPWPRSLGAVPYIRPAVARARSAEPGTAVPLKVVVHGRHTRAYVARVARRVDRPALDARLLLRRLRPYLTKHREGRTLDRPRALRAIVRALVNGQRGPLRLRVLIARPEVTRASFGPVVVIRRESRQLFLYRGMRPWRTFGVAVGQSSYPTPLGRFSIVALWRNPWWYPPDSDWAAGAQPIPPGSGNPLGTRWMGLSASGVGIHGTPDAASIGYSASHGCIRMRIPEAEWLFNQVEIGTTVYIVAA